MKLADARKDRVSASPENREPFRRDNILQETALYVAESLESFIRHRRLVQNVEHRENPL